MPELTPLQLILTVLTDIETIIVFVLGVSFLVLYTRFFQWRKTAVGRALVYVLGSLVLVALSGALVRNLGSHYWGREYLSPLFWFAAVLAFANFLRVLWMYRHRQEPLSVEARTKTGHTGTIPTEEGKS